MVRDTHDDEPNTWLSIGLQAALIVNKLRVQAQLTKIDEQKPEHSTERERDDEAKKRKVDRLEFVNKGGRN